MNYFLSINFNKLLGLLKYISCVVGVFYCCAVVETVKGVALRLGLPTSKDFSTKCHLVDNYVHNYVHPQSNTCTFFSVVKQKAVELAKLQRHHHRKGGLWILWAPNMAWARL